MQEKNSSPRTLGQLAEPLRAPGALPGGISLATGIIANYSPADVKTGIAHTEGDHAYHTTSFEGYSRLIAQDASSLTPTEFARATQERHESEIALRKLAPERELADMVRGRYGHYGRRGRVACLIAGGLMGLAVSAGIVETHKAPQPSAASYAQMTSQEREQVTDKQSEAAVATAGAVFPLALGLISGYIAGQKMNPRFARRRAQQLIDEASRA